MKITAILNSLERLTNSANNNPRFKLHTSKGTFQTLTDGGINYGIENNDPIGHTVVITLSENNRVTDMEKI
jgi:hypothetical protein